MSTPSPPERREMRRSSRSAISAGGRSVVITIWCPTPCSASVRRKSSDCISLRFVRNCTSSTSNASTFWKRRRNASPWPAAMVLRPAFLPERKPECDGADRDRGVGHIERGPAPGAEADVDEVDDSLRAANPVDEIADGAATDERQRQEPEAIARPGAAYQRREHHQRHDRESEKDPAGVVAEMQSERRAFVVHQAQLHADVEQRQRQTAPLPRFRVQLGR